MRGQSVAVTIYPSPLGSPRPPWDPVDVAARPFLCKSSLKGSCDLRARVTDLPLELLQTNSLVSNCIVCIYEWEQQRRPTEPVTFLSLSLSFSLFLLNEQTNERTSLCIDTRSYARLVANSRTPPSPVSLIATLILLTV